MTLYMIVDIAITCLEAWFMLVLLQNEEVLGKKSKQIVFFIAFVVSMATITWLDLNLLLKYIINILVVVTVGRFVYKCSFFKLFLYGIINIVAFRVSEEIVIGIWNIYNPPVLSNNIIYEDFILSLVLIVHAFYFFIIMLVKKITSKDSEDRTLKEIIPIFCIGIPFLLVLECLDLVTPFFLDWESRLLYVICCAAILMVFIYVLTYFEKHLLIRKKAQEEKVALYELQLKYDYYVRRKEEEEKIKEIYHDLKNHLLLLKNDQIVKNITKKIEAYESYIDTGNEFLDIIISEKARIAQQKNIRIECDIDFSSGDFVEPLDISTIFGNLIDNAIEASEEIKNFEKYIFVKVKQRERLLSVVIKNSMLSKNDLNYMKTPKFNQSFHGYGLINVKRAIKKYNGEYDIKINDSEFMISAFLPIPVKRFT